ncbi:MULTISPECIES: oligopeptide ABC transporter permease [Bacillaceae]|uniref:Peptide ABC transporter permease n=2 Tax=Bacillus infantis TaxID=324767 RepID=U5L6I9_9BACI|nr:MULTISPECIES: oligopeptide ABC transporter permease [Bacillus]OXT17360.1 peptide ABC transporter permease [Bacillus sp. OG2]AGX03449.1 peptide ABC transporter permease [Bacillus infantis NRRL B-14911]EAR66372.1 putative oligopeptide transport system permease protein [Bacillus sp. NRRL B-14911]MCA1034296.1 ABC transporter permease [Bacillus infantis]MCK6204257.1 ABC transporter permease [Bacillus infantis]
MEPTISQQSTTAIEEPVKPPKSQSPWALARRKFLKNKLAMISLCYLVLIVLVSIFAEPLSMPIEETAKLNLTEISKEPSAEHYFGTDKSGRDVFARTLHGGKTSLTLAFSITISVVVIGTIVGATAGFFGGWVDNVLMRFTDFMMNFPFLLFVIVLKSIFIESSTATLIFVISVLSWTGIARLVRSKVMVEKENEYIMSSISIGCSSVTTIFKHLLPNVMSTIIVQATLTLAAMIVAETGLSFLGFGVPMNIPSWGNMLQDARSPDVLTSKWWIWIPPATVLTLTILSINFVGEGLKDAFNPKSNR